MLVVSYHMNVVVYVVEKDKQGTTKGKEKGAKKAGGEREREKREGRGGWVERVWISIERRGD